MCKCTDGGNSLLRLKAPAVRLATAIQSKEVICSRVALNPEKRFQSGPIIAQIKGPKFKSKQRRIMARNKFGNPVFSCFRLSGKQGKQCTLIGFYYRLLSEPLSDRFLGLLYSFKLMIVVSQSEYMLNGTIYTPSKKYSST